MHATFTFAKGHAGISRIEVPGRRSTTKPVGAASSPPETAGLWRRSLGSHCPATHLRGVPPQRQHARLHTHCLELSGVEVVCGARQLIVVDVRVHIHLAGVDLWHWFWGIVTSAEWLAVQIGWCKLVVRGWHPGPHSSCGGASVTVGLGDRCADWLRVRCRLGYVCNLTHSLVGWRPCSHTQPRPGTHLQDLGACLLVRVGELDLAIQAA